MLRYHRQTILPQIGNDGQRKLLDSKVLIVGAGGLGHPVAQYLAAMGVGQIEIIDGDHVHITNLHRQILFTDFDIGRNKAEVLAQRIAKLNGSLKVSFEPRFLDRAFAIDRFGNFDLIVDCTDNFETKFLINDVCAVYDKPMIYGAISQFEGQVGVFWKSKGACYRCLYEKIPDSKIQNCAEAGVVGPIVGIIGSMQAMEAMKVIIGNDEDLKPLAGKVNFYNFCDHTFRNLSVPLRASCPCHWPSFDQSRISEYSRPECKIGSSALLVDVREPEEWNEFHIEGSYSLPLSQIEAGQCPELEKGREIVLICKIGARAKRAKEILNKLNYTNISCAEKGVYEY
ncbi:MAG: hypothetical protein HC883_00930 [Bdellovibrionaceae bacterium]|nr:hypothetical protein [Pseudobdellovibrionaceae bacterium]